MVEKYEGEELCSHCLRALIRAGARGKDLFGVQQDWLGSSEMMKVRIAAAQFCAIRATLRNYVFLLRRTPPPEGDPLRARV